jgi:hypothetical protein
MARKNWIQNGYNLQVKLYRETITNKNITRNKEEEQIICIIYEIICMIYESPYNDPKFIFRS